VPGEIELLPSRYLVGLKFLELFLLHFLLNIHARVLERSIS